MLSLVWVSFQCSGSECSHEQFQARVRSSTITNVCRYGQGLPRHRPTQSRECVLVVLMNIYKVCLSPVQVVCVTRKLCGGCRSSTERQVTSAQYCENFSCPPPPPPVVKFPYPPTPQVWKTVSKLADPSVSVSLFLALLALSLSPLRSTSSVHRSGWSMWPNISL